MGDKEKHISSDAADKQGSYKQAIQQLNNQYEAGMISKEEYQKKKAALQAKHAKSEGGSGSSEVRGEQG